MLTYERHENNLTTVTVYTQHFPRFHSVTM